MTKIYKTARGKTIDMDKIKLANERTTAVGNMKVNARGDKLGAGGEIVAGRNQVMDRVYNVEARSRGGYSPTDPKVSARQKALVEASRAQELHNLATNLVKPTTASEASEPTIATEPAEPAARGSLASSVAKTVSVTQEPLPDPKKSNGPTRI